MKQVSTGPGRLLIWAIVCVLFVLHQDFWWWNDRTMVLGFLPISLAYHAAFSVAAGLIWALACKFAWPSEIEEWASQEEAKSSSAGGHQ